MAGLTDQMGGVGRGLPGRQQPADDGPAEKIQDHVQREVEPLDRALELRDVPDPDLVGPGG